jgi:hypothetical protein
MAIWIWHGIDMLVIALVDTSDNDKTVTNHPDMKESAAETS